MKTTLKRGIGRAAAANGNGRAVYPPGARTPMRRYRQPQPAQRTPLQLLGRILGWTLVVVLMVGAGTAGGAYLYYHQSAAAIAPHDPRVQRAVSDLEAVPPASQPAVALVVGYDKRAGHDPLAIGGSRSDTIMLIRADPTAQVISMLSFPRDLVVTIHCPNRAPFTDRINAAYGTCGPQGTLETVKELTGLPINYLITVNFHGFKVLVNKVGGVFIDVDHRYYNKNVGTAATDFANIDLHAGYQKLDGQEALDYVRYRHNDSDLYRNVRQQLFVRALKDRVGEFSLFSLPKLVGAIKENHNVEIAQGGGGPVPFDTALSYARFAYGLPTGHFFQATIGDLTGINELSAPQSAIDAAVHDLENPDVAAPQKANAAALGQKPKPKAPTVKPQQVHVLVLNGTNTVGLARDTSYELALRGFRTAQLATAANAPSSDYSRTEVYYDPAGKHAKASAELLAKLFPGSEVAPMPTEILPFAVQAGNPEAVVVVGSTFTGKLAQPAEPTDTTPKHEPPAVFSDPGMTLSALRAVRRRVPFALEVPHLIARQSQLTAMEPVRVYRPAAHHNAVRVTFVTGDFGNEYWGIEETDWTTAPILRHPSETRTLGGRRFDFYYSGSHLHMVVLRDGDTSYWVVNTLLDRLSNETMIAVARGLKPLRG